MASQKRILDEQLCFSIYTASREFTKFYRQALEPFELTYPQYLVLLVLWEEPKLSVKELGTHLALDSGTLTPMLKRMETMSLIKRTRSKADERKVYIELTDKAIAMKDDVLTNVADCISKLSFTEEAYFQLLTGMKELTTKIQENNGGTKNEKIV
ncbi:MarR family winged helix-turn-helix transcriptional regulator [Listeria booriae]|uniref:MarR family transcriptional regulator n=1 Tax=Listeria booriae TaxID=1552123 RepID=A0A7X1CHY1_9LIST|nr:MarR family transcriptional regulator [Listeria booriae]MBC1229620.1 MarR family transcriptional regulator [Listeria booriae]MBC1778437.1 MarR family transcriptional regulator [Listeria booriae]MBC1889839.1 MarR family transcriptional regulator [Listeria booriae]MBC1919666.1 MarR family transcriptional regulator [Listeria booriae]MBC2066857.1 MarR family transcriptional regulator [Listeria booriae]